MAHRAHKPHKFNALSKPKQLKKSDHKHYWPYIPVLILVVATFVLNFLYANPNKNVLAYSTNLSHSALLTATNSHRSTHGSASLSLNSQLSAAAQAKANDMVRNNYWSHNSPDGQEPWIFIQTAGYEYLRAGENLAYGFKSSDDVVMGWMNSPTHKTNLLDSSYNEVGFGFANSDNFLSNGPETIVVAMYAQSANADHLAAEEAAPTDIGAFTTTNSGANPITEPMTLGVTRAHSLTGGKAPWIMFVTGLVMGLALMALLVKHAAGLRHVIRDGEKFILKHPVLDTVLVSLVLLGTFLSQTSGFVK